MNDPDNKDGPLFDFLVYTALETDGAVGDPNIRFVEHGNQAAAVKRQKRVGRMKKSILLCGGNSFAAKGLADALRADGHEVTEFDNGNIGTAGDKVYGPVMQMGKNPHLKENYDVLINYILLKDKGISDNIEYMRSLLRYCKQAGIAHLVHISSVSIFKAFEKNIHEESAVERNPDRLGPYAAQKLATENDLVEMIPDDINLTLIRPGFIIGDGLHDPIIAAGFRAPLNSLLVFGNASSFIPLIARETLNKGIVKIVNEPPIGIERLVMVSKSSPTKKEYLKACNELLNDGKRTLYVPAVVWLSAGLTGEVVARIVGKKDKKVLAKIAEVSFKKRFDASKTEQRVGFTFDLDWRSALKDSFRSDD